MQLDRSGGYPPCRDAGESEVALPLMFDPAGVYRASFCRHYLRGSLPANHREARFSLLIFPDTLSERITCFRYPFGVAAVITD
jgi:hypothetical protein